ncbi:unnamed protein product, partial [marine sediment metagenome]
DSSEWNKVSKYFGYHDDTVEPENTIVETYKYRGWAVYKNSVKEVEKILDISKENCVEYRDNEKKKQEEIWKKEKAKEKAERENRFDYIGRQFENAETPDPDIKQPGFVVTELRDYKLIEVEGIEIRDPRDPANVITDSGELWIIQKKWIWKIKYTRCDGYGNNVLSGGHTRGIGVRVPYTEKLAGMIIGLTSREFTTKKELGEIEEIYGPGFEKIWSK